jgi:hypothetical protein
MASTNLPEPTEVRYKQKEHSIHDFSQDAYNSGEYFSKCISLGFDIVACINIDLGTLDGAFAVEEAGITDAKIQYTLGESATLDFEVRELGQGSVIVATIDNGDGKHSIQIECLVIGPFGIEVLDNTVTVQLPF